jgi:hypothetical protein
MLSNRLSASLALLSCLGALGACGGATVSDPGSGSGSTSGSGSLSGSVAGTTFQVASELAAITIANGSESCIVGSDGGSSCTSTSSGQSVLVLFTNRSDATCAAAQSEIASNTNTSFANMDALELLVTSASGEVTTGAYEVTASATDGSGGGALFATTTASCGQGLDVTAIGGTITLTQVGATGVTGSYSVDFGAQGTFTGSFDVPICNLPDGGSTSSSGPPICQP